MTNDQGLRQPPDSEIGHRNPWPIRAAVMGAIATLVASLGGLVFSGLAWIQSTEQVRQATAAQTSERFSRSVEQLGSDSIAVRNGAVYSFGRLMRDSEVDQRAIVEILSSFVRLRAGEEPPLQEGTEIRPTPVDLLATLTVLDDFGYSPSMFLKEVNLSDFDLYQVAMRGANLRLANLTYTDLTGADLSYADLAFAHLTGAYMYNANLTGADLTGADLTDANLTGVDLTDADLTEAVLSGVTCTAMTKWPEGFNAAPHCE